MNLIELTRHFGIAHGVLLDVKEIAELIPMQDRADIKRCTPEELQGWAQCLAQRAVLMKGLRPEGWIHVLECEGCGDVWSWHAGEVIACEWCHVRVTGRSFPRPSDSQHRT